MNNDILSVEDFEKSLSIGDLFQGVTNIYLLVGKEENVFCIDKNNQPITRCKFFVPTLLPSSNKYIYWNVPDFWRFVCEEKILKKVPKRKEK